MRLDCNNVSKVDQVEEMEVLTWMGGTTWEGEMLKIPIEFLHTFS